MEDAIVEAAAEPVNENQVNAEDQPNESKETLGEEVLALGSLAPMGAKSTG